MKAAATKTASGMKATATVETAAASTAMEAAAPATVETAAPAPAMARLGYVCEREPRRCARQDPSKR
jgi:hypothetical protein